MMAQQSSLLGVEEAPPTVPGRFAVHGHLWRPARLVEEGAVDAWIWQGDCALPVYAHFRPSDPERAAELQLELQQIGTPVLAVGELLQVAVVDSRECLRFALTHHLQRDRAQERLAA